MKHFIFLVLFLVVGIRLSCADVGKNMNIGIHLNTSEMPAECEEYLKDRIASILSQNGVYSSVTQDRFFIVAKPKIISEEYTDGTPQMVSVKITISFRIGDAIDNRIFTTFTQTYHGVAKSKQKAWMNAIKKVINNSTYSDELHKAQENITDYYEGQADQLIKLAYSQSQINEYDRALATLSKIPTEIQKYYLVRDALVDIYRKKIIFSNSQLILKAQNDWISSPDRNGARLACNSLSNIISPSTKDLCQIFELYESMNKRISEQDLREFEIMKQQLTYQHELTLNKNNNETQLWSTAIQLGFEFLNSHISPINVMSSFFNL